MAARLYNGCLREQGQGRKPEQALSRCTRRLRCSSFARSTTWCRSPIYEHQNARECRTTQRCRDMVVLALFAQRSTLCDCSTSVCVCVYGLPTYYLDMFQQAENVADPGTQTIDTVYPSPVYALEFFMARSLPVPPKIATIKNNEQLKLSLPTLFCTRHPPSIDRRAYATRTPATRGKRAHQ